MLSVRLHGADDLRLDDIPVPEIGPDEILIKTEAAAVCGTDVRMWRTNQIGRGAVSPLVLGHELCGVVEKKGRDVTHLTEGTRVAVAPNFGCGTCRMCVAGKTHLCGGYLAFGINMDGAFAEYVRVPAAPLRQGNVFALPAGLTPEEAALNEPLSCVYNGFTKCSPKPGEIGLVVGAGPIGLLHAQLLHSAGLTVAMSDISEERLALCRERFPFLVTYSGDALLDFVRELTAGVGLDVAVVACPVPEVQARMLTLMNYGGRINFFGGIPKERQPVAIDTNQIHYKELFLTGSTRASVAQFRKTLDMTARGLVDLKGIVTARIPIQNALTAFDNARKGIGLKNIVTF